MKPRIALLCHEDERLDACGLAAWLAASMDLVGIVEIRGQRARRLRAIRRELRRSGWRGLADVFAFRVYDRVVHARQNARWVDAEVARLEARYPSQTTGIPRVTVDDPNHEAVAAFLSSLNVDLAIARCKVLLRPSIFAVPRHGTFVLHPGICPEYRNAHGCFWALTRRDLDRVGMTLLRIDEGVDTGPVFLRATYAFDETRESHTVIQHRVVTENLDAIASVLTRVCAHTVEPVSSDGRSSAVWGQPRLTAYFRWRRAARRERRHAIRDIALS